MGTEEYQIQCGRNRDMILFASMGGAPPTVEALIGLCGLYILLPLTILMAALARYCNSIWPLCLATMLSGLPLVLLLAAVSTYEPSDDWDVMSDQSVGWGVMWLYAVMTALTGLPLLWIVGKRFIQSRKGNARLIVSVDPLSGRRRISWK
jgi:hypothetical protein